MEVREAAELCFPELLNASCLKPVVPWSQVVLLSVLVPSVSMLTVLLNLLVIISVSHFRQLHTPTNLLLLSLAVSDFLVGLLLSPSNMVRIMTCWWLSDYLCVFSNYLSICILSASVGNMVLISVDRYVAICSPLYYNTKVTVRRVQLCVCFCWLLSALYSLLMAKMDLENMDSFFTCRGKCVILGNEASMALDLVVSFIIPISVIILLYTRVFVAAVTQARTLHTHVDTVKLQLSVTVKSKRSELKAARTIGVVLLVFLVFLCPFFIVTLFGISSVNDTSASFTLSLFYFNSCLNPLIYALFFPWFRKASKLVVTLRILQPGSSGAAIMQAM